MENQMGLADLTNNGLDRQVTVGDLIDVYGEEAVRRGLEYMSSLDKADRRFRESADRDDMEHGYKQAFEAQLDTDKVEEGATSWEEGVKDNGLGISEE